VASDHLGGVLDRVARLLVRARLLEDVGGEHVPDIMRPMRQQPLDLAAAGVRVVDAIALDRQTPGFIEGRPVIGSVPAVGLHRLDE